jgi:1-acyl-sn-glycerol-3-phosphate acyltransferase
MYNEDILLSFNQIKQLLYALYLTNSFGFKLKQTKDPMKKKKLRLAYSEAQLKALNIEIKVDNPENLPKDGQHLRVSNHRTIIDTLIPDGMEQGCI